MTAGLGEAPSVVLTTNDDATNIFLAIYCRRLNPHVRIVTRITHERNLEAIHRARADSVLSYSSLGVKSLLALLRGHDLLLLGKALTSSSSASRPRSPARHSDVLAKRRGNRRDCFARTAAVLSRAVQQGDQMKRSELRAVFAPDASHREWSLCIVFDDAAFGLPGDAPAGPLAGVRRPDLHDLTAMMFRARAACIIRTRSDGAIEISASDRSAFVLHEWLLSILPNAAER
jgi:hypothetical protein